MIFVNLTLGLIWHTVKWCQKKIWAPLLQFFYAFWSLGLLILTCNFCEWRHKRWQKIENFPPQFSKRIKICVWHSCYRAQVLSFFWLQAVPNTPSLQDLIILQNLMSDPNPTQGIILWSKSGELRSQIGKVPLLLPLLLSLPFEQFVPSNELMVASTANSDSALQKEQNAEFSFKLLREREREEYPNQRCLLEMSLFFLERESCEKRIHMRDSWRRREISDVAIMWWVKNKSKVEIIFRGKILKEREGETSALRTRTKYTCGVQQHVALDFPWIHTSMILLLSHQQNAMNQVGPIHSKNNKSKK